jgi:hypothetical protein
LQSCSGPGGSVAHQKPIPPCCAQHKACHSGDVARYPSRSAARAFSTGPASKQVEVVLSCSSDFAHVSEIAPGRYRTYHQLHNTKTLQECHLRPHVCPTSVILQGGNHHTCMLNPARRPVQNPMLSCGLGCHTNTLGTLQQQPTTEQTADHNDHNSNTAGRKTADKHKTTTWAQHAK